MKRWEENIYSYGEEFNVEKKGKGKQDHLPYDIKAFGKNIKWGRGRSFWEEIQDMNERRWKKKDQSCKELYTRLF